MSENQDGKEPFTDAPSLPAEDQRLIDEYRNFGVPVDQLMVSGEIYQLASQLNEAGDKRTPEQFMQRLLNLRKAGRLPRFGMASPSSRRAYRVTVARESLVKAIDHLEANGVRSVAVVITRDGSYSLTYSASHQLI